MVKWGEGRKRNMVEYGELKNTDGQSNSVKAVEN